MLNRYSDVKHPKNLEVTKSAYDQHIHTNLKGNICILNFKKITKHTKCKSEQKQTRKFLCAFNKYSETNNKRNAKWP